MDVSLVADFSQLIPGIQCRNCITKLWTGILNRMYLKEVKCTPKTKHHLKSMLTISTCVESKIHTSSSCFWWCSERVWFLSLGCFSVVGIGLFCRRDTAGTSAQQKICLCKQKDQKLFMWIWFNFMWLVYVTVPLPCRSTHLEISDFVNCVGCCSGLHSGLL